MTQQKSLFGSNMPNLDRKITGKDQAKAIAQKAQTPRETRPRTVARGSGPLVSGVSSPKDGGKTRLINQVSAVVAAARQKLTPEPWMEYLMAKDEDRFREYMYRVRHNGIMSIDTETTGLDPIDDKLVGVCLYTPGEKSIYVPVWHTDFELRPLPGQMDIRIIQEELQKVALDELIKNILHNAKFDIRVVNKAFGIRLRPYWCTLIGGNMLNENEPHGLKYLWNKYVARGDGDAEKFGDLFEGIPFNYIPIDLAYIYGCKDPKMTYEVFEFQEPFLTPDDPKCQSQDLVEAAHLYRETEIPLIYYVSEMEDEGITLDFKKSGELSKKYGEKLKEAEQKCHAFLNTVDWSRLPPEKKSKLGNPINLGSPQQMAILFYDFWGLKSPDKEKPRGTGEDILEIFEKNDSISKEIRQFFKDLLDHRGQAKLLGTYIDKMPAVAKSIVYAPLADPLGKETMEAILGQVHASFNQYGAVTGRFSSSDPNLQNIPNEDDTKEIRTMFRAAPGHVLISGDYSQQEPRCLAHVSGDERLNQAYREGKDIYSWMGSIVYTKTYAECLEFNPDGSKNKAGKKVRSDMKAIVLGRMYGRGDKAIAEGLKVSLERAKEIVAVFDNEFPGISITITIETENCKRLGYIKTVWGRKRRLPDLNLPPYDYKVGKARVRIETPAETGQDPIYKEVDPDPEHLAEIWPYYYQKLVNARFWKDRERIKEEATEQGFRIIDNGFKIADAQRQVLNSIIQGTSADITKKAMVALGDSQELRDLGFKMLLTVHDEVIGQAPRETALKCAELMRRIMIEVAAEKISVPMKVDLTISEFWEGEDVTDQLPAA